MKRWISKVLAVAIVSSVGIPSATATASMNFSVVVDGAALRFHDAQPLQEHNRVLIPIRHVSESLGAAVGFDGKTITITKAQRTISLTLGSKTAKVDGAIIQLDVAATARQNRTYVPLRFIGEAFDLPVNWNPAKQRVYIGDVKDPKILSPEEMGIKPTPVEKLKRLYHNPDHAFLKTRDGDPIKGFYVIERRDLPVRINDYILYDVWAEKDAVGFHFQPDKPAVYYLTESYKPRLRSPNPTRTVTLPDGSKKFYYSIISKRDKRSNDDQTYNNFTLNEVKYIGLTIDYNGFVVLIKYPLT